MRQYFDSVDEASTFFIKEYLGNDVGRFLHSERKNLIDDALVSIAIRRGKSKDFCERIRFLCRAEERYFVLYQNEFFDILDELFDKKKKENYIQEEMEL